MPFQTTVFVQPAPAVEGDFASSNPRANFLAGPAHLVAGVEGVTVGRFAWIDPDTGHVQNKSPDGVEPPAGFIHREQQALIDIYLDEASMMVPRGFGITMMIHGDFWCRNNGAQEAQPGKMAFVDPDTGEANFEDVGLETKIWYCRSRGAPGELVKISTYPLAGGH
jgi:hypothetical protein